MTAEAPESASKHRLKWLILAFVCLIAVATLLSIEPMRLRLPYRYLIAPLDVQRTGLVDFEMCMRVELSEAEALAFVSSMFDPTSSVEGAEVDMADTHCDAAFWPVRFDARAMAYEIDRTGPPYWIKEGTSGAVYQDGYFYFWSNAT